MYGCPSISYFSVNKIRLERLEGTVQPEKVKKFFTEKNFRRVSGAIHVTKVGDNSSVGDEQSGDKNASELKLIGDSAVP